MSVTFVHKGGAQLHFVHCNLEQARGYDILIVMAGGNDLASGAKLDYYRRYYDIIETEAREMGVQQVIITSFWPRQDSAYNTMVRQHHEYWTAHYDHHNLMTFWTWDRRQCFRTYDGIHLEQRGYQKAIRYLIAPILWAIKRIERAQ